MQTLAALLGCHAKFCSVPLLSSPPRNDVLRRVLSTSPRHASASPPRTVTVRGSACGENMLRLSYFFFFALLCFFVFLSSLCDVRNVLLSLALL